MTSRASARHGGSGTDFDGGDDRWRQHRADDRGSIEPTRGADAPVTRILSSLDQLGERIKALSATQAETLGADASRSPQREPRRGVAEQPLYADGPARSSRSRAERATAGIELQRAIEQIARKRDALERGAGRGTQPFRGPADEPREPRRDPADGGRPDRAAAALDPAAFEALRSEMRELRRSVERLGGEDHLRELRGLGDRVDAIARSTVDPRLVASLRDDLAALRETVVEALPLAPLKALESNYDDIVRRLDQMRGAIDNPRMLGDIVQRMSEVRRLLAQAPTEAQFLAVTDRLDALAERVDRHDGAAALGEMELQLTELAKAVAALDQSAVVELVETRLGDVSAQVAGLERRLASLDTLDQWQDVVGRQTTVLSQVAQRSEQLPRVAHEMERQSAAVDGIVRHVETLPRLASDMAAVRRAVDGEAAQAAKGFDVLLARIDDLAARMERMAPGTDPLADQGFQDRLADIASRLDRLDGPMDGRALELLERHFAQLTATIEGRLAAVETARAEPSVPAGLMEALGRIEAHLSSTPEVDRFAELEDRVVALTRAVEGLDRLQMPELDGIERGIAALRAEIGGIGGPSHYGVEAELRTLAARIDAMVAPAPIDVDALIRLERRLVDVVTRLDERPDEATLLADALARFERTLADTISPDGFARAAAESLADQEDETRRVLDQLQRDLAGLQDDLRGTARRDRELLLAIGEAVERLARREIGEAPSAEPAPAPAPAAAVTAASARRATEDSDTWKEIERTLSEGLKPRKSEADEDPLPRIFGRRGDEGRREPSLEADGAEAASFDANMPLEPGSGKPNPRMPPRLDAASDEGDEARLEPSTEDFKAQIAAARRAAQTANARAAGAPTPLPGSEPEPSVRKRLSLPSLSFLKAYRRQLALGGVAALVVIGAAGAVATLLGSEETEIAAVEQPAPADAAPEAATQPPSVGAAPSAAASDAATTATTPETPAVEQPAAAAPAQPVEPAPAAAPAPNHPTAADAMAAAGTEVGPATSFGAAPDAPAADGFAKPAPAADAPARVPAPMPSETVGTLALRQAAADGNPVAQFEVAARLTEGRGVAQDLAAAAEWYRRAAEAGLPPAQYRLGSLYEKGQGVARDAKTAAGWYEKAADAGNAKAMHNLAVLHAEGGLGQPDYATAAGWFQKAADHGVRDSQYNLGILYARGLGVARDLTASYKWFAIAAQAGDADSAKKRDDVAQVLDKDALARARLAVETWRQVEPDPAANDVTVTDPAWLAVPEQTAATGVGGDLVSQAQALLARRGFDPGPADGKMGKRTRDAIAAFQKQRGLPVTGDVDAHLIQALAEQAI